MITNKLPKNTKSTNEILVKNSNNYQNTKITKDTKVGTNCEVSKFVQMEEFSKNEEEVVEEKPQFIF